MFSKGHLSDNVFSNRVASPFISALLYLYLERTSTKVFDFSSIQSSLIFFVVFFYCSRFFQPDLDGTPNRPGMSNFPFGQYIMDFRFLSIKVRNIMYPINRVWYFLWEPYAILLTHRGISHWPILGTLTRVCYLSILLPLFQLELNFLIEIFTNYNDGLFYIVALPIYLSDIIHFLVDLWDSVKIGKPFCSRGIPRGLIARILNL